MSNSTDTLKAVAKVLFVVTVLVVAVWGGRQLRNRSKLANTTALNEARQADGSEEDVLVSRGEILYMQHCAKCHGDEGNGDGEGLRALSIRPRDFHSPQWRFEKTEKSIQTIIRDGIPGTPMPASKTALSDSDINSIASYVLKIANEKSATNPTGTSETDLLIAAGFSPVIPASVPDLKLSNVAGENVSLGEFKSKPMIVHFWGTYCAHCIQDMPRLNEEIATLNDSVSVISLCADVTEAEELNDFAEQFANMDFHADPTGLAMNRFGASLLPSFYFVDKTGTVLGVTHQLKTEKIQSLIE
ncbi:redoxin domain-containing protein [Thalassoglobus polymorphus]|uniref:Thiol-disulfide oxidoreductase ResA n=1 Tax=Thalassoglobus polymorphus TaxID=2527994 RepID=A0A517QKM7_9PLAN|nr:redoxin domain-containing protein [Thalassoglobus polymorphus]QDT32198.1 Thiol-disulfide oxidoreductase ResA [Thalassoglobus polymorphus]